MVKERRHKSLGERVFDVFNVLLMLLIIVVTVLPFWLQLCVSLSARDEVLRSVTILWPKGFNFETYQLAFEYDMLYIGYKNTILRVVLGVPISLAVIMLAAYPLSVRNLPFRRGITAVIMFTMLFGGGMIPNYLLISNLGMLNTIWSLVLPGAMNAFYVLVTRNFFMSLPASMHESAFIDGARPLNIFVSIIIPLSTPIVATMCLFILVDHWNAWFDGMLYMTKKEGQILQMVLRKLVLENNMQEMEAMMTASGRRNAFTGRQLQATVIMLSTIPMLIIYPFIQKYFVRGIMIGAVKG